MNNILDNNKSVYFSSISLILLYTSIILYLEVGDLLIKIDLTSLILLSLTLSGIVFVLNLLKNDKIDRKLIYTVIVLCFFILHAIISLQWSSDRSYGMKKLQMFLILLTYAIIVCNIVSKNQKVYSILILIGGTLTVVAILFNNEISVGAKFFRLNATEDSNPIKLSAYLGLGVLSLVANYEYLKRIVSKYVLFIFVGVLMVIMFLTGSKGPILSLIITLLLLLYKYLNIRYILVFVTLLLIGIFVIRMGYFPISDEVMFFFESRYDIQSDESGSVSIRADMLRFVVNNFYKDGILVVLFGNGIGDFNGSFVGGYYPHNILAEFLYELGVIWLIILCILLLYVFTTFLKDKKNTSINFLSLAIIYGFFVALSTGDISNHYLFFSHMVFFFNRK